MREHIDRFVGFLAQAARLLGIPEHARGVAPVVFFDEAGVGLPLVLAVEERDVRVVDGEFSLGPWASVELSRIGRLLAGERDLGAIEVSDDDHPLARLLRSLEAKARPAGNMLAIRGGAQ